MLKDYNVHHKQTLCHISEVHNCKNFENEIKSNNSRLGNKGAKLRMKIHKINKQKQVQTYW